MGEGYKNQPDVKFALKMPSPVHSPSILGQELLTGCFEGIIGPQIRDGQWSTSNGINTRFLNVLDDANTIKAATRRCHDRIVHNLERDTIDQVIGDNLRLGINTTTKELSTMTKLTRSSTSP